MKWTLFDYGVGNIHSLRKAIAAHAPVHVTRDPRALAAAEAVVLPGVGAFGAVMAALEPARTALEEHHASGRPLIGVCIGMQALYQGSDESEGAGLGFVGRRVRRLPREAGKVPHMGWNTLEPVPARDAGAPPDARVRQALQETGHVYFVHSYAAPPGPETLATAEYGMTFDAAVRVGNTIGFQFHPEKSSTHGRRILHAAMDALRPEEEAR